MMFECLMVHVQVIYLNTTMGKPMCSYYNVWKFGLLVHCSMYIDISVWKDLIVGLFHVFCMLYQ